MRRVSHLLHVSLILLTLAASGVSHAALRTLVAEEFTGTWCPWCPSAMQGLYNLEQQVGTRLAVVAYHVSDSFQIQGCVDRKNYYAITGYPTVMFDGIIRVVGGDTIPVNYTPYYQQREGISSPVIMDLALLSYDGSTGAGTVRATIFNEPGNPAASASLRYVAVGDDTLYNWQGFNHLYFTALHIFPSAAGVPVNVASGAEVVDVQTFQIPAGWRDRACTIVAFLQNDTTKEILQGGLLSQVTPVELVSFTAQTCRDGVLLSWTTASETENAGFRIWREVEGHKELLTGTMIQGSGTSAIPHAYEYVDRDVAAGMTYAYVLSDVSLGGVETFHPPVRVSIPGTWGAPSLLRLEPPRPCPAVNEVALRYSVPSDEPYSVRIYDMGGRAIRDLCAGAGAGFYSISWDLADDDGVKVPSGLYLVRVVSGSRESSAKVIVTH